MEDLNLSVNTTLIIISNVIILAGIYWKVRIDIIKINVKIADIVCDRKERWGKYEEEKDKQEAYSSEILKGMSEVKGDIKAIRESIKWLEKK